MNKFISESAEFRKKVFEQTGIRMHTQAHLIEKDFWPVEKHTLKSYASIEFSDLFTELDVMVTTLSPVRTFWEKLTILHEETFRPEDNPPPCGYSRHYYDIYRMDCAGITEKALPDIGLRKRVVEHKTLFYKRSWSRYDLAAPGTFKIIPSDKTLSELKKDYAMMEPMIFGDIPTFDDIISTLTALEQRINAL